MASALPVTTALVAWAWLSYDKTLILLLRTPSDAAEDRHLLHGSGLHCDVLAAGIVRVDALGVARLGGPLGAGIEVADHVDLLLALRVDGER